MSLLEAAAVDEKPIRSCLPQCGEEYHTPIGQVWHSTDPWANDRRGCYRGKTCRYSLAQAWQFLTHRVISSPSIDALRKDYSIRSSASESRLSEILMPSAFAVARLRTVSNLVDWMTGRSARRRVRECCTADHNCHQCRYCKPYHDCPSMLISHKMHFPTTPNPGKRPKTLDYLCHSQA
jgi:hypothetical protein